MKAFATRALHAVVLVVGLLLATFFFVLACQALQLGPFIPTGAAAQPAHPAGFALLLASGTVLFGLFRRYLD